MVSGTPCLPFIYENSEKIEKKYKHEIGTHAYRTFIHERRNSTTKVAVLGCFREKEER